MVSALAARAAESLARRVRGPGAGGVHSLRSICRGGDSGSCCRVSTLAGWVAESPSRLVRGLVAGVVFGLYVSVFVQFSLLMKWQSSCRVLGKKFVLSTISAE